MQETFSPLFPEEYNLYPNAYKILVLGESGVGKTAFIEALSNCVQDKPQRPLSGIRKPTTELNIKYIPATSSDNLQRTTMEDDVRSNRFSKSFANFALNQHGRYKIDSVLPEYVFNSRIASNREFKEIIISEMPIKREDSIEHLAEKFDKIIIMGDYTDITSLRSMQYWATKIKAPKKKTIICVNKCDVDEEGDYEKEDFQLRKAKVMCHFLYQCGVEYISVNTLANIGFIYKYL